MGAQRSENGELRALGVHLNEDPVTRILEIVTKMLVEANEATGFLPACQPSIGSEPVKEVRAWQQRLLH